MAKKITPKAYFPGDPTSFAPSAEELKPLVDHILNSAAAIEKETSTSAKSVDVARMDTYCEFDEATREDIEGALTYALRAMGMDLNDPEFTATPRRVTDLLEEFSQKRSRASLEDILGGGFVNVDSSVEVPDGMVVQKDIPFRGLCAHHVCPFLGQAYVGYIPKKRIVGLSKITRLVQAAGTQFPSTQEVITNLIAQTLWHWADPVGVMVVTRAQHTCMSVRGVNSPGVDTLVSIAKGVFLTNPAPREEFLALAGLK
jgi:GTP cyclohydrolase IA